MLKGLFGSLVPSWAIILLAIGLAGSAFWWIRNDAAQDALASQKYKNDMFLYEVEMEKMRFERDTAQAVITAANERAEAAVKQTDKYEDIINEYRIELANGAAVKCLPDDNYSGRMQSITIP